MPYWQENLNLIFFDVQFFIEITPESTAVQVAEPDKERFQEKGNPKQEDLVANNNERTEIIEGQENESEGDATRDNFQQQQHPTQSYEKS